jgi:hypothetical protein
MKRPYYMVREHNAVPLHGRLLRLAVVAPLFLPFCALSQQNKPDPLLRWMDQIAQEQLRRRETTLAGIRKIDEAERRKKFVRETILSLLGGLPDYSGPLNSKTTGTIHAEGYAIEKVIFESLPGVDLGHGKFLHAATDAQLVDIILHGNGSLRSWTERTADPCHGRVLVSGPDRPA